MLTSSCATRRLIVSTSCFLACTISEFERRSGMINGARSAEPPGCPGPGGVGTPGVGTGGVGAGGVPGAGARIRPLAKSWVGDVASPAGSAYVHGQDIHYSCDSST